MTTDYVIGRIAPYHFVVAKFEGGEAPAAVYTVKQVRDGWRCDCADAVYRQNPECKHVRMIRAHGLLKELDQ